MLLPFMTLLKKEMLRFIVVATQTIFAPTVTATLFLLVFGLGLGRRVEIGGGIDFSQFVIPGLILMGVATNSFQNVSSSLFISRYFGNIVDYLVMPLTPLQFLMAYTLAGVARGLIVGVCVWAISCYFAILPWPNPLQALVFLVVSSFLFAFFGFLAAVHANSFDHLSVFLNFIITPLVFLGGVFYPINLLPGFWSTVSKCNPVLYLIDGVRGGMLGVSEISPLISLSIALTITTIMLIWCVILIRTGYKLRT